MRLTRFLLLAMAAIGSGCSNFASGQASKDTLVQGLSCHFVLMHPNGSLLEAGEALVEGRKQGRWLQFDLQGQLVQDANYSAGKLDGQALFIYPVEGQPATRERGRMAGGLRSGIWIAEVQKREACDKWKLNYWTIYNILGKIASRITFHDNRRPASVQTFDSEGNPDWEIHFDRRGRQTYAGPPETGTVPLAD